MRAALPFLLVSLAVFAAVCIVYIAWELSSDKDTHKTPDQSAEDD